MSATTTDRGPTIIRSSGGWTAVGERFAAGGPTIEQALANYWNLANAGEGAGEVEIGEAAALQHV